MSTARTRRLVLVSVLLCLAMTGSYSWLQVGQESPTILALTTLAGPTILLASYLLGRGSSEKAATAHLVRAVTHGVDYISRSPLRTSLSCTGAVALGWLAWSVGAASIFDISLQCLDGYTFGRWPSAGVQIPCDADTKVWAPLQSLTHLETQLVCGQKADSRTTQFEKDRDQPGVYRCRDSHTQQLAPRPVEPIVLAPNVKSCNDYQRDLGWSVACTPSTAGGHYWRPDSSRTSKWGNFGVVYQGTDPICNESHLGTRAFAAVWPPSHEVWNVASVICPNALPGSTSFGSCPSREVTSTWPADRPLTECPAGFTDRPECGIYVATCSRIGTR